MKSVISRLIRRFGQPILMERDGQQTKLQGLVQHFGSKSWRSMERTLGALGEIPQGQYVYIGPASPAAAVGDVLCYGGKRYELRRTELVWLRDKPLYCWGLCIERGDETQ